MKKLFAFAIIVSAFLCAKSVNAGVQKYYLITHGSAPPTISNTVVEV